MKIYLNLLDKHGRELLADYKAGTLKSQYRREKGNGGEVLLWTGRCQRTPKKSVLARRAQKEGLKKVVLLCPPTIKHLYTFTFNVKKNGLQQIGEKAFIVE
jgi:hypothetical protein